MLRGLIPHGDHKRDKASFLLEVGTLLITIYVFPEGHFKLIVGYSNIKIVAGHRVHSVLTGKSTEVRSLISRMEPRCSKIDVMGKLIYLPM